jgi:exportin-1
MFFTSFLCAHLKLIEKQDNPQMLILGHMYLLKISKVDDREVFKTCLEYWTKFVSDLYNESPHLAEHNPLMLNSDRNKRRMLYRDILSQLRLVMIESMVKPEEVLIVENDEGEIVREFIKETDTITLYKSMKEVLVYLTHLDVEDTETIISNKLSRQVDRTEWSWNNLNKLCWATGSISGAMSEEAEKRFIVFVIKDLLGLCESVRGKDNKAVVASNIMYVVGQYPRFLRAHWKFLKTVVNKLFEFMHELHEGVQDMACDTFIKIAQKCKRHFVIKQPGESSPFIEEIIHNIPNIVSELQSSQVHVFYEAVGHMINAETNRQKQEQLILELMEGPNNAWDGIMQSASQNAAIFNNPEQIKQIANIMKTNVAACNSVGSAFIAQIARIFMDVLNVYQATSQLISQAVAEGGLVQTKTPRVRGLRTIKKEILKLIQTYVLKTEELQVVLDNLVPPMLDIVLGDYNRNVEPAREAEVLHLMASIVQKLGPMMTDRVPVILENVFEGTLNMINKDFSEYPDHRVGFFNLLKAINQNCFMALLNLPPPTFKLILDSIVWGFKHTMRDIADTGLLICIDLLSNVSKLDPSVGSAFYQNYYLTLFQDVFYVLTDREHKSGMFLHVVYLR